MDQKDLSGRLARWSLKLQGFKFEIKHRKGSLNVVPDCLSRQFEEILELQIEPLVDLESAEFLSEKYRKLLETIRENEGRFPDLRIVDKHVYKRTEFADGSPISEIYNWKLWVPQELTEQIIENAHSPPNKSHGGIAKTIERLKRNLYWPKMSTQVKEFIDKCEVCHTCKATNKSNKAPMIHHYETQRPFQKLYVDLLGPYPRSRKGHIGIFIVVDHFSKYVWLKPIKKFTTEPICEYLKNTVFSSFGTPEVIMSDNGKQFVSKQFKELMQSHGVQHHRTALYSPQANASERVNRSILVGVRAYIKKDQANWDQYLEQTCIALRSAYHQAIGCSPYFAAFGQQMVLNGEDHKLIRKLDAFDENIGDRTSKIELIRKEVKEHIEKAFQETAKRYNLRSRETLYKEGETVYRKNFVLSDATKKFNAKLAPKYIKATVIRKKGSCIYELKDVETGKIGNYHQKDIKATKNGNNAA